MSEKLTEKVSFDFIRYANCWEDADVLLAGLHPEKKGKFLSIGSAGDNSFSLLTTDPELVVAIDVNKIQNYLIELKRTCIQHLSHEETLSFLGFTNTENREVIFKEIKGYLKPEARAYWESHVIQIKNGIITQGKFENYFKLFASKILPWIHSKKNIHDLLRSKSAEEQKEIYHVRWNNWRWKLLFKIFFSKYIMGKYGRDPEFLKEVKVPVANFIYNKAENHLQSILAQQNFILRFALTGSFGDLLPHYLRPENFKVIKSNLERLEIKQGFAESAIKKYGSFNYMNLSNIFEYMDHQVFLKTAGELVSATAPQGRLAYWNLMVPRRISDEFAEQVLHLKDLSNDLAALDRGFFYNQFTVDQIK